MRPTLSQLNDTDRSRGEKRQQRIFIVDDHPIFRHGFSKLVELEPDLCVCGMADTAREASDVLHMVEADAAVVDLSLPGSSGIDLLKELRAAHPGLPLLVVSVYDELVYAPLALNAGATGYVMKREDDVHFLTALRTVLAGRTYISPTVEELLGAEKGRTGGKRRLARKISAGPSPNN